jgi:hypothetical protein
MERRYFLKQTALTGAAATTTTKLPPLTHDEAAINRDRLAGDVARG